MYVCTYAHSTSHYNIVQLKQIDTKLINIKIAGIRVHTYIVSQFLEVLQRLCQW